ncbi:DUF302 domain-containing protein, partial [Halobium palmae]
MVALAVVAEPVLDGARRRSGLDGDAVSESGRSAATERELISRARVLPPVEYFITERAAADFDETLDRVRAALESQGFGVLGETDLGAAVRDELGDDAFPRYVLIAACNPTLAREALDADPNVGVLL